MMERKYFDIDERSAKIAHEMMSFREFTEGRKTAEYRAYVDDVYDLVEKVEQNRPEDAEKAYKLAVRYAYRLAENMNKESRIGMMCPSVMISGGSNFPVRKKQRQVAAWDANHKDWQEVQKISEQIEHILRKGAVIQSDDENALEKLEAKLEKLKTTQERMKLANRAIRMKDTEEGDNTLREMGYTDEQIKELRSPDFCGRVGYPNYILTNNNANIHRIEKRIEELKAVKDTGTQETDKGLFKVIENTDLMRLQLVFDGKPEPEVRDVLKSNGFRWAPSQGAWQRQLTPAAQSSLRLVMKKLGVE